MDNATITKVLLGAQFKKLQEELKQKAFSEQAQKEKAQQLLEDQEKRVFADFLNSIEQYLVNCLTDSVLPKNIELHEKHIISELGESFLQAKSILRKFTAYNKPYYNTTCHVIDQFNQFINNMNNEGIIINVIHNHDGCGVESWSVITIDF